MSSYFNSKGQFYTVLGTPESIDDDRVIVFLHGLGSSQNFHYPVASRLAEKNVCLLIDHEGAANSKLNKADLSLEDLSENVFQILQQANLVQKKIILVGHSMSGMLINYINIYHSDKINIVGNVLIAPVHPTEQAADVFSKRIELLKNEISLERFANIFPELATGSKCSTLAKAFIRQLLLSQNVEGYCANCRAIVSGGNYKLPSQYNKITARTMIIRGEEDKVTPWNGCIENIAGSLKNVEVFSLPNVGHWIVLEAPDEVYEQVSVFLRK